MNDKFGRTTLKLRNAIRQLHRASVRTEQQEFLVEGPHACLEMLKAGLRPRILILTDEATPEVRSVADLALHAGVDVRTASTKDVELMCSTRSSQGILMVMPTFRENVCRGRVVALDAVADPGNVGTIIRTAAWFGCTDVVVSDDCADVYNPKVVRSSAGALASVNIIRRHRVTDFLDEQPNLPVIVADAHAGINPKAATKPEQWCLVIGSEAHGVSEAVMVRANIRLTIQGSKNVVESLNAAVAAAVLLYELTDMP
ncbi:MAG: hypothetical protein RIR53_515 [Bacteroidota bacterium]|jgi:TrmH family RNA methyltransferase